VEVEASVYNLPSIAQATKMSKGSRSWCFTINNYTEDERDALRNGKYAYMVFGYERGVEGTPHLQGYVHLLQAKTLSAMKKIMPRAHLEIRMGTVDQAVEYCKKEGDFEEFGVKPLSQKEKGETEKKRWKRVLDLSESGDFDTLKEEEPRLWVLHEEKLRKKSKIMPDALPIGPGEKVHEWYYGVPGSGKSHKARVENPGAYLKRKNKWWDGYEGQEVVIIEEWSPDDKLSLQNLKEWADKWPFAAERKGGYMNIRPKKIIVCSNYHPNDCCERSEDSMALARRFKVTHFNTIHK